MPAPAIKLCGINTPEALDAALAACADYVGFNFYPPSPRFLALDQAAALGVRAEGRITRVGVFVDADEAAMAEAAAAARLDAVQLHGGENPERAAQLGSRLGLPVWKVISVAGPDDIARAERYREAVQLVLFDAKTPKGTLPGGMGLVFDWKLLSNLRLGLPWGLAGGLSADNVAEAARISGAPLVDTASGIESAPGVKDPDKIAAFCKAARSA
ncbi:phosphoribosylanthranilate isomerase [Novosphingobium sp.]|uniref:phosphoribosylanthranilate isomerase n=1 Tax=Novosphingobium sp. TaxID=1874826 RepID=UPI0025FCF472|nr:phosphoribosylanthranilate isomerase [Novosphingobium sp.]MCC6925464.1 phosphoribosylanthranilate isomerase [Novosphingobium sp.]